MEHSKLQQHIEVTIENVTFFSNFDSGNLLRVSKSGPNQYELWIAPDAHEKGLNNYRIWFYFGIKGVRKGSFVRLSIMNLCNMRAFASGSYRPVWKSHPHSQDWQTNSLDAIFEPNFSNFFKLSWVFEVNYSDDTYYFAFCPPYSYADIVKSIDLFESYLTADTYYYREILAKSFDNRNIELLTISAMQNMQEDPEERLLGIFPTDLNRCLQPKKPIIFISSRVHPGETPASYMLDGFLKAIISDDRRGEALRNNFVFKIIPVLNPDGVYRGHFRVDQNGVNLNRCYIDPSNIEHPAIYAVKTYIQYLLYNKFTISSYLDFHAHGSKRGCFVFGNALDTERQIDNLLFAKLTELNSPYFEYIDCDFSEKSMSSKDHKDTHSKEGSGRVNIYRLTNLPYCYTVECGYHTHKPLHILTPLINTRTGRKYPENLLATYIPVGPKSYNKLSCEDVGAAMAITLLDIHELNPVSRLNSSDYKNLDGLREWIRENNSQNKAKRMFRRAISRDEIKQRSKSLHEKRIEIRPGALKLKKLQGRLPHRLNIVSPILTEKTMATGSDSKRRQVNRSRGKSKVIKSRIIV